MNKYRVYSKDGSVVRCTLTKVEYSGTFMGDRVVTSTIISSSEIPFDVYDYVFFRGEKFELEMMPTVKKVSSFQYEYELRFVSLKYELERCMFRNLVPEDNGIVYPSTMNIEFTGTVSHLTERIQACLDEMYGTGLWSIIVNESSGERNISVTNYNCWSALSLVNTEYGLNYYINGRTIFVGGSQVVSGVSFEYGKGNGLYEIERVSDTDSAIITKLFVYGSTRNLDYTYPKQPYWEDSVLPESFVLSPLRLMLPSFKKDGETDYIVASSNITDEYGIREGVVVFDDIYPSIEGKTNSFGERIDKIRSVDEITEETGSTFVVYLNSLGFDLEENLTTETAQISMKTGSLQGETFNITKIEVQDDTTVKLTLERNVISKEDGSGDSYIPSIDLNIAPGDEFVFLGILMPKEFIRSSEEVLLSRAKDYLNEHCITNYTYNIGLDEIFMYKNSDIYEEILEGKQLEINDYEIGIYGEFVTIQTLVIEDGDGMLPRIKVTLNNKPSASTIDRLQAQIDEIKYGSSEEESSSRTLSALKSLGSKYFLRKDKPDSTKYLQKFLGGIHVGEFLTGAKGIGMYKDANGNWHIETDYIDVRLKLTAKEVEIQHVSHIGGMLMNTPANMIVSRVEETDSSYICYMNTEDDEGNVIENMWAVGDQAYCETFNLIQQADGKLGNHFLWRLVTSVGEDYIELSKLDCAIGSDAPLAGDNLVVLGNRSNIERQGAIVLASAGSGSPYIRVYKDIIGYSLPMPHIELSPNNSIISATKIILESSGSSLDEEMQGMNDAINSLSRDLSGNFLVWQAENDDIPTLNNEPAVNWENDTERFAHVGDFYITTSGWVYQFDYDSDSNTYYWKVVTDKYLIKVAKDVEERSRTFVETPTIDDVYDIGDTWVNAIYPEDGSIYDDDTLVCIKAKDKGEPFDISHWRKDSKYTDDTKATLLEQEMNEFIEGYASTISDIQGQIDGKAETWYQENDPSADWTTSELKAMHKGDLWYNEETGETFYWNGTAWEQQNIPKDLFDRFDGKATIYVSKPINGYMRNDMWILEKDYTLNGEDLKKGTIVFTDTTSETFVETHWGKYDRYTDDTKAEEVENELNDFITSYEEAIADIRKQIDGKAETWYQESDPSAAWDTDELKAKHVGDLWYNTTEEKTYYWNGSKWEAQDIPQEVFDDIDGKSSIYVSQPKYYKKNDIWVLDADYTLAFGIKYKKGTIVFALEDSPANGTETLVPDHWGKKDIYTDDEVVDDLKDKLFNMGIRFEDGQIVVTTDSFLVQDTNGTGIAIFNIDSDGNPTINGDYLNVNHINIADGAIVFEKDGSGHLANGAISWDSEGTFLNHINIESGTIGGFTLENGVLTTESNGAINFELSENKYLRINTNDEILIDASVYQSGTKAIDVYAQNSGSIGVNIHGQAGATALQSLGDNILISRYSTSFMEQVTIAGLSLSTGTGVSFDNSSNIGDAYASAWVDFLVADGDVTLPNASLCSGKILFIKCNGTVQSNSGIMLANDASITREAISRNRLSMIFISDGTYWYEFWAG